MNKPSVSEKEMLGKLDLLKQAADAWVEEVMSHTGGMEYQKELDDAEKVLRALILAVGEWKKRVDEIFHWTDVLSRNAGLRKLANDIRDFGEGKNETST